MRAIIRKTLLYTLGLYSLTIMFDGVTVEGGMTTYLIGGFALAVMFFLLRPILLFITLPLHMATLGLFSIVVNAFILYILTRFLPQIAIQSFVFPGFSSFGLLIPKLAINMIFAYILSALVLSFLVSFISWTFKE